MRYPIAEKFKAPQGEGMFTGVPMAFIRFVGCSVGKKICTHCDTDFDKPYDQLGGGMFTENELIEWVGDLKHICLTGGEPLDRNLEPFLEACERKMIHIESSGTVEWLKPIFTTTGPHARPRFSSVWLTISPKPGFRESMITKADEVKVIIGGLGEGEGWPTLEDALRWAREGKTVYIQPRNEKNFVDNRNMASVITLVMNNPSLRLSAQLHKYIHTR